MTIINARISSTFLGIEDHGCFTCDIGIDYGSGTETQIFGGYSLSKEFGINFLRGILETVGVEKWEDLKGKLIRIKEEDLRVVAIGNILEDVWFDPKKMFKLS